MTIGQKIKNLRENRNLTLNEVSEKTKLSIKEIKRIENDLKIPTRPQVYLFCDCFQVKEDEIINEETRKDTVKIEAKLSFNNLAFWIMNVIVCMFFVIVAFLPTLSVVDQNGVKHLYSFYELLMIDNNSLVIYAFICALIGLVISLILILLRFIPKLSLNSKIINIFNLILLIFLIVIVVTIFIVVIKFSSDFVGLIV